MLTNPRLIIVEPPYASKIYNTSPPDEVLKSSITGGVFNRKNYILLAAKGDYVLVVERRSKNESSNN